MALSVAIQMDPIASIHIETDTTFVLALEAQRRGHKLYYYTPRDMFLDRGEVMAWVAPLEVRRDPKNFYTLGQTERVALKNMDVVLLRQDPPFDMHYITTTHYLELIMRDTLVVNNPVEVRNCPEKLFVCHFPQLMPPTLITEDIEEVRKFRKEYGDVIIKPLYSHGGKDVFHLGKEDKNLVSLVDMFLRTFRTPFIVQQFLPKVMSGDKRIMLIDGNPVGAINRVPAEGEVRSNLAAGGKAEKTTLTEREREICSLLGPALRQRGLLLVGIDVIGGYLTEINVTSPTGLQVINRLDNAQTEILMWDVIEGKL